MRTADPRVRPVLAVAAGVVVLAGSVALGVTSGSEPKEAPARGDLRAAPSRLRPRAGSGEPLPDFSLGVFRDEAARIEASSYRGVPLVLNFWASWCPFCVEEMPGFEKVHRRMGDAVAFLGVDLQDDPALAAGLVRRTGVTYPIATDPDGALFAAVRGVGMPTTLLVTADGRIARKITGPLEAEDLEAVILEHLVREVP